MGERKIREIFNVESGRRAYMAFIDRLRNQLKGDLMVGDCPVLPSREEVRSDPQFEIVLQTNQPNEITLLFRRHDISLEAYKMGDCGPWLEFSTPNQVKPVIQGSESLGFDGRYDGSNGIEVAAGIADEGGRVGIALGGSSLIDAVNTLAISNNRVERAKALLVVIQMTAESLRLDAVLCFVLYYYYHGSVPDSRLLLLEKSWKLLSYALLRSDLSIFPIENCEGLLCEYPFTQENSIGEIGMLWNAGHSNQEAGRPLVQVFNVKINDINHKNPCNLHGKIKATDGLTSQYIYNRHRDDAESVRPSGNATLTGPETSCILAVDDLIIIDVSLMDKVSPSQDEEVSKGQITLSPNHDNSNAYVDVLLSSTMSGHLRKATIYYAVFSDAVQANVEVKLIHTDPADVYGKLSATISKPTFHNHEIVLFQREDSSLNVQPQQLIPLNRSVIAVPMGYELRVHAELFDNADSTVNFPVQLSGISEKTISGKKGAIQVKVTWKK